MHSTPTSRSDILTIPVNLIALNSMKLKSIMTGVGMPFAFLAYLAGSIIGSALWGFRHGVRDQFKKDMR